MKKELALQRAKEWEGLSLWPKILPDAKPAFEDSSGEVCFCLLLPRILKWMHVDKSHRLLLHRGCCLQGTRSEDIKIYQGLTCVTLGKLIHQFLFILNHLSLLFFSLILSCFVWLHCLVTGDKLYSLLRHVRLLRWNSFFNCCCSNSHSVCLGGPPRGGK